MVESGGLENRCARKGTEGSNPSLSGDDIYCRKSLSDIFRYYIYRKMEGFEPNPSLSGFIFFGEMSEWSKVHDWKSCVPKRYRGFESLSLRRFSKKRKILLKFYY